MPRPASIEAPRGGAFRRYAALALATAGGAGLAPVASGTFGSAVGVALFVGIAPWGATPALLAAALASGLGIWASDEAERIYARKDDGRIVIDEVAGQLVALWPLALLAPDEVRAPLPLLVGFLVFRAFDIVKPGPVRWAERSFPGGRGVMFDDLLAGTFTALLMAAALLGGLFS